MGSEPAAGRTVTVEVSATSANLGPGFDCFGLALDWPQQATLEVTAGGYPVELTGEGAATLPRDTGHLVLRTALAGLADLGAAVPGLGLRAHNTIPQGRGLGSSSAAIVAGLLAAWALARPAAEPDTDWLLRHADAVEGHPDNVAAAIHGGFVLAYAARTGVAVARGRLDPQIAAVVLVPEEAVATEAARGLLPTSVPHAEAAAGAGRAALLVHALAGEPDLLHEATRDWLHQDYRAPAMPRSAALVDALREAGYAAVISGAGPSVLVLGRAGDLRDLPAGRGFVTHRVGMGRAAQVLHP